MRFRLEVVDWRSGQFRANRWWTLHSGSASQRPRQNWSSTEKVVADRELESAGTPSAGGAPRGDCRQEPRAVLVENGGRWCRTCDGCRQVGAQPAYLRDEFPQELERRVRPGGDRPADPHNVSPKVPGPFAPSDARSVAPRVGSDSFACARATRQSAPHRNLQQFASTEVDLVRHCRPVWLSIGCQDPDGALNRRRAQVHVALSGGEMLVAGLGTPRNLTVPARAAAVALVRGRPECPSD